MKNNELPASTRIALMRPSSSDVEKAIRCYCEVEKGFKPSSGAMTKVYLKMIAEKRLFFSSNYKQPNIGAFKKYLELAPKQTIIKEFGLKYSEYDYFIHRFKWILVTDVLNDLKDGRLFVKNYLSKEMTKTELLKNWNKMIVKQGLDPIPLRKKRTDFDCESFI